MVKISVLTPVYNVEKYLPQCLDSLINQTFNDVEFICIDDGSTDSSGEILDRYAERDSRIHVIHKPNSGYGKTMNMGLDHATGKYIAVIESDDFVELNMLETMYLAAEESQAEITKADHYNYIKGVDYLCNWLVDFPCRRVFETVEHPQLLEKANTIWSCLFRRDFLLQHGIRFHETPGAAFQDISFAMQTWLWAKSIYFIEGAFVHYRNDNPDSSMHNPDKIFCTFDEFGWLEEMFKDFWVQNKELEKYFIASKYHDYFSHYSRIAAQYQYAFLLRFYSELKRDSERKRICETAFRPKDYNKLMDLEQGVNAFFNKTGKLKEDLRLNFCSFENETAYVEGFISYLRSFSHVILYGAGKVGKQIADLCMEKGLKPAYFAVTEKNDINDTTYMNIPVAEIQELSSLSDKAVIILAVAETSQYELYQNAVRYNFKHILRIDNLIRKFIKRKGLGWQ